MRGRSPRVLIRPTRPCAKPSGEGTAVTHQATPCRQGGGDAHGDAADAEQYDDGVPEGALVVEEREIEAVEPVVQPSVPAAGPLEARRDHSVPRVQIQPGLLRVVVADAQNRQRP